MDFRWVYFICLGWALGCLLIIRFFQVTDRGEE
jgi:hypothetical protein